MPYFGLTLGQYPNAPKSRKPVGGDGTYHTGVLVIRWHGGAWEFNRNDAFAALAASNRNFACMTYDSLGLKGAVVASGQAGTA